MASEETKESGAARVEYLLTDHTGQPVSGGALERMSAQLKALLESETVDREAVRGVRGLAVMPGDVIAKVEEEETPRPDESAFVAYKDGQYWARRYGYACLSGDRLSVLSPLWSDPLAVTVYWLLLDERPRPVTGEIIHPWLTDLRVVEGLQNEALQQVLKQVREGQAARGPHLICAGVAPVPGSDARVEILVNPGLREGRPCEDGSLDYGEVAFSPDVRAGQLLARRTPPAAGRDGRNVRGQRCPAPYGADRPLKPGKGVRMEASGDIQQFIAEVGGVVRMAGETISVSEMLLVDGSVGFNTGNIRFEGDIFIRGSVGQNFTVRAGGDVVVTEGVEPGAAVIAQGSVTVGKGISGRKTRVLALGDVRAQFVEEATVQCPRSIVLGNYARDAFLRATEVRAASASGKWGGSVFGGQVWGLNGIDVHVAGNAFRVRTALSSGMDLETVHRLEEMDRKVEEGNRQITGLLRRFNLDCLDVAQIRNLLAASSGAWRILLARSAHDLGLLIQDQQSLLAGRKALVKKSAGGHTEAVVRVRNTAYPGVTIRLGDHQKTIQAETASPAFRVRDGRIVDR